MSSTAGNLQLEIFLESDGSLCDEVQAQVWDILGGLYPSGGVIERREENRYPYPYLIHLTPVGEDGQTPQGESIVAVGKHLSNRGLGFYHPRPLPYRHMIASLEATDGGRHGFLIDLTWCRFTKQGWYESGGRFIEAVRSPLETQS